jgi:DNA repair protein RecO (recombination protein O)
VKHIVTTGIILSRTDYGEADRILTVLTPDQGKLRLIAKGVRRMKSKMAGGIDLFTVSDLTYIPGRGEIGTLVSSRMQVHYGEIVKDIDRVQLGYELIKQLNKTTEDEVEASYFELLQQAFVGLNDSSISLDLVSLWFYAQLLRLGGHAPNLRTDTEGQPLEATAAYIFSDDDMAFVRQDGGEPSASHIKLLRLLFSDISVVVISKVEGLTDLLPPVQRLMRLMIQDYVRH